MLLGSCPRSRRCLMRSTVACAVCGAASRYPPEQRSTSGHAWSTCSASQFVGSPVPAGRTPRDRTDQAAPPRGGRVPRAPRPHRDVHCMSGRGRVCHSRAARPSLAGAPLMICDCYMAPDEAQPLAIRGGRRDQGERSTSTRRLVRHRRTGLGRTRWPLADLLSVLMPDGRIPAPRTPTAG